ncbi:MAG: hypothetical protein RL538_766 [Candidatus Parcubacteria bacterium]|jgi:hypothetical protein
MPKFFNKFVECRTGRKRLDLGNIWSFLVLSTFSILGTASFFYSIFLGLGVGEAILYVGVCTVLGTLAVAFMGLIPVAATAAYRMVAD